MYNGTSNKWTKHFDFIIVDVICINVAFFLATLIYSGSGHMYNTSLYRNVTISLTLIHFCVAFFRNGYSGILRRGYLKEMKDVVYHNAIIMAVLFSSSLLTLLSFLLSVPIDNRLTFRSG